MAEPSPPLPRLRSSLREHRQRRRWSQAELARRSGLSRAGVSAIETERLVPSAAAALALAQALDARVEDLFALAGGPAPVPEWAWPPLASAGDRQWLARIGSRLFRYPVEATLCGVLPDDGSADEPTADSLDAERTVVLAGCDPAVGLLASVLQRSAGIRLIPLARSSRSALELLAAGKVHLAGVHLGDNAREARSLLGPGYALVRVATWQQGLALAPDLRLRTVRAALRANLRWVGREEGSGARRCLDRLLADRPRRPRGSARAAAGHTGVAGTIQSGWAQAGVCVRLAAEQAGLDFLPLEEEAYDLCTSVALLEDPRVRAVLAALRSSFFQRQAAGLAGYDAREAGGVQEIA